MAGPGGRRGDYERIEEEDIAVPLFPVGAFTPASGCPHRGRIRVGSRFVCMVCHQYGRGLNLVGRRNKPDEKKKQHKFRPKGLRPDKAG